MYRVKRKNDPSLQCDDVRGCKVRLLLTAAIPGELRGRKCRERSNNDNGKDDNLLHSKRDHSLRIPAYWETHTYGEFLREKEIADKPVADIRREITKGGKRYGDYHHKLYVNECSHGLLQRDSGSCRCSLGNESKCDIFVKTAKNSSGETVIVEKRAIKSKFETPGNYTQFLIKFLNL